MSAQILLLKKYGNPDKDYFNNYCINWAVKQDFPWFPANEIFINKEFKLKLAQAFTQLEKNSLQGEVKTFDGCYNDRSVRGHATLSLHAWAVAIDLNASTEKLGQTHAGWSGQFVAIMKATGLFWGGDWINRKDPMHWALMNG